MAANHHIETLQRVSDKGFSRCHENFIKIADEFDPGAEPGGLYLPVELTRFYGEPVFENLSPDNRVKLNRLTWCQMYHTVAMMESVVTILNQKASHRRLSGADITGAIYIMRESAEEFFHIEAFVKIIEKTLKYYNISMKEFTAANKSGQKSPLLYYFANSWFAKLIGLGEIYYLSRYALNISLKSVERTIQPGSNLHSKMQQLLVNHRIDESRHQTMSIKSGRENIDRIKTNRFKQWLTGFLYAHWVKSVGFGLCGRPERKVFDRNRFAYVSLLSWCGISRQNAEKSYTCWVKQKYTRGNAPLINEVRGFYIEQNLSAVEKIGLNERVRQKISRLVHGLLENFA